MGKTLAKCIIRGLIVGLDGALKCFRRQFWEQNEASLLADPEGCYSQELPASAESTAIVPQVVCKWSDAS